MAGCAYGDPTCPCQDGDDCHYEWDKKRKTPPWPRPDMRLSMKTKAQVVDELRRIIGDWSRYHLLTDEQVVAYMAMIAAGYAERAYVTLPHQAPPKSND